MKTATEIYDEMIEICNRLKNPQLSRIDFDESVILLESLRTNHREACWKELPRGKTGIPIGMSIDY